jgi:cytochrome b561
MNRRRHVATTIFLALTGIFALGAFIQPFTAGIGIFGGSIEAHQGLGGLLHVLTVLGFLAALISPTRRRDAPLAFALTAIVTIQLFVVEADATAIRALHPFLGVSSLLLAVAIHLLAGRDRTSRTAPAARSVG